MRSMNGESPSSRRCSAASSRLFSLDALRGLDMMFIIGLDCLIRSIALFYFPENTSKEIWRQLNHSSWDGLTVCDIIFPLFVFISGTSMFFSLSRAMQNNMSRPALLGKLWKRALILVALGILVNFWSFHDQISAIQPFGFDSLRYASVLGLIGISGAFAGTLLLLLRRFLLAPFLAAVILAIVWGLQTFGGDMTPTGCFNAKVDALLCPGWLHSGTFDPEGPLCIVSATALSLLGFCAGSCCRSSLSILKQSGTLALHGLICLGLGAVSGMVIKGIWTPAFVFTTGGIGFLLLALSRLLFDTSSWGNRLSLPLRVVGMNALAIYVITRLPIYKTFFDRLDSHVFQHCVENHQVNVLIYFSSYFLVAWFICFGLWRHRIFIKL